MPTAGASHIMGSEAAAACGDGPTLQDMKLPIFGDLAVKGPRGNFLQLLRDQSMQRAKRSVDDQLSPVVVIAAPSPLPSPSQADRSSRSSFNIVLKNGVSQDVYRTSKPVPEDGRARLDSPPVKFHSMQSQREQPNPTADPPHRASSPGNGYPAYPPRLRSRVSLQLPPADPSGYGRLVGETSNSGISDTSTAPRSSTADRSPILRVVTDTARTAQHQKQQQQQLQHEQLRSKLVYVPSSKSNPGFTRLSPTGPANQDLRLQLQLAAAPQSSMSKLTRQNSSQPPSPLAHVSSTSPRGPSDSGMSRRATTPTVQLRYMRSADQAVRSADQVGEQAVPTRSLPVMMPETLLGQNVMQHIQEAMLSPCKPVSAIRTLSTPASPLAHHAPSQRTGSSMVFFLGPPR